MLLPSLERCCASILLSLLLLVYALRKRSLSLSGALVAIVVGIVLTCASGCFCLALLAFFLTSSRLTKWKASQKKKLEYDHKEGGQRNWIQVVCNGGVATLAALLYVSSVGYGEQPFYLSVPSASTYTALACLASLACCCGDTWASEVGSVAGGVPRLITTGTQVPRGTNGGVTTLGVACSFAGGLVVGAAYFIGLVVFTKWESFQDLAVQSAVILLGGVAGLGGSFVDSLLGATLQYSGYSEEKGCIMHSPGEGKNIQHISGLNILDNHAVNLLSSAITAVALPSLIYYIHEFMG